MSTNLANLLDELETAEPAVLSAPPAIDSADYDADTDGVTMSLRSWIQWKLG